MKEDVRSGKQWKDVSACAFCRTPAPKTKNDTFDRLNRGMERNNARSFNISGIQHVEGHCGREKNVAKGMALLLRGGELGCYEAYHNLGRLYYDGEEVQMDMKKAQYFFEIAAIGGSAVARYHIGILEETVHHDLYRASKHYLISAKAGFDPALNELKECYRNGYITRGVHRSPFMKLEMVCPYTPQILVSKDTYLRNCSLQQFRHHRHLHHRRTTIFVSTKSNGFA